MKKHKSILYYLKNAPVINYEIVDNNHFSLKRFQLLKQQYRSRDAHHMRHGTEKIWLTSNGKAPGFKTKTNNERSIYVPNARHTASYREPNQHPNSILWYPNSIPLTQQDKFKFSGLTDVFMTYDLGRYHLPQNEHPFWSILSELIKCSMGEIPSGSAGHGRTGVLSHARVSRVLSCVVLLKSSKILTLKDRDDVIYQNTIHVVYSSTVDQKRCSFCGYKS